MGLYKSLNGFDFNDKRRVHDHIGNVASDHAPVVPDFQWHLQPGIDPCLGELMMERIHVNGFKKARTEYSMDFHCSTDDLTGQVVCLCSQFRKFC